MARSNQKYAHYEADCSECYKYIAKDDPIWINAAGRFCTTCAAKNRIECPVCHGTKKPEFEMCYQCNIADVMKKAKLL